MLLLSHIIIALLTLVIVSLAYCKPSAKILQLNYLSAGLTLATGTVLTILNPSHLVQSCLTGIAYFSVVSLVAWLARRKLATLSA